MSLLRGEGLRRRYAGRLVVDVDAIGVERGEVLAVLGPNGAGKSTLFRLFLLLEPPDEGRVLLDGRVVRPGDRDARRRLAGVFQRPVLFTGTVAQNVAYGLRARGADRAGRTRRVGEMLALLGLERLAGAPVQALSGGEAQRVALARALAPRPEVLLLDEPTANLDIPTRRRFREDLERLVRTQAGAAVLITHDPADAFALADRIAVMEGGRLVQVGSPEDVVLRPTSPFVAAFTGAELLTGGRVLGEEGGLLMVGFGDGAARLRVPAPGQGSPPAGAAVHVAYRPEDVVIELPGAAEEAGTPNCLRLRVAGLSPVAGFVRVRLDGDVALSAVLPRAGAASLGLAPGIEVIARLDAEAAHLFPAG